MSFSIGIVGLPNVGKSTLFKALTKKQVDIANYPFCTISPNVGVVEVPDERLEKLADVSKSKKIIPTAIEFVDIAGLVKGAHKGEGLGNQFLSNIREVDAICQVVRNFDDKNVVHTTEKIDPANDMAIINLELILADLSTVNKRLEKVAKDLKSNSDKKLAEYKNLLEKLKTNLNQEKLASEILPTEEELKILKDLNLLTIKPIIYVFNVDEKKINEISPNDETISISAKIESEIAELPQEEAKSYLKELGLKESGLDQLIKTSYKLLNLATFFTSGEMETKAWTVTAGSKAPAAAGKIHTDFEKGFIRAEVINWQDLVSTGSETKAKEKGLLRIEGKDYIIQDGDVVHFRFAN